jgi:hypothetical protein
MNLASFFPSSSCIIGAKPEGVRIKIDRPAWTDTTAPISRRQVTARAAARATG